MSSATHARSEKSASRNGRDSHTLARQHRLGEIMDEKRRLEIGGRLQRFREAAALTQEQVAERAKVGKRTYQSWEYGEAGTDLETYEKLAKVLAVDVRDILHDSAPELLTGSDQTEAKLDEVLARLAAIEAVLLSGDVSRLLSEGSQLPGEERAEATGQ